MQRKVMWVIGLLVIGQQSYGAEHVHEYDWVEAACQALAQKQPEKDKASKNQVSKKRMSDESCDYDQSQLAALGMISEAKRRDSESLRGLAALASAI